MRKTGRGGLGLGMRVCGLALLAGGCDAGGQPEAGPPVAETSTELRGGVPAFGPLDGSPGFLSSVVYISGPGGTCTGTLVTPRHVLTAAHCSAPLPVGGITQTIVTSANPSPGFNPGAPTPWSGEVVALVRNPGFVGFGNNDGSNNTRGFDQMILTLKEDVAVSDARPLPVWLGSMASLRFYEGGALLVGYGRPHSGQLRLGQAKTLSRYKDPCDFLDFGGCFIGELWESESSDSLEGYLPDSADAGIDKGDSGGPLMFNTPEFGWTVGGVLSGHYEPFGTRYQYHASTGSGYDQNNAAWITEVLGSGDLDGDGIIDSGDNCPPARCAKAGLAPSACQNTLQADSDGDGVGDSCDNCPGVANADQKNSGGYREGDACDLCPERWVADKTASSVGLPDADSDGVPDACDNCPTTPNPRVACSTTTFPGVCITSLGLQARQLDADGDNIGNECDQCGPGWVLKKEGANANPYAEDREDKKFPGMVPARPDVCEAVPVATLSDVKKAPVGDAFVANGQQATDVTSIELAAVFGREKQSDPDKSILAQVDFAYCDCRNDAGEPLEDSKCLAPGERCDVPSGSLNGSKYVHTPTIRGDGNKPLPPFYAFRRDVTQRTDLEWAWSSDVLSGAIPGRVTQVLGKTVIEPRGALLSRVRKTPGNTQPGRDASYSLRDHVAIVGPGFTLVGSKYSLGAGLEVEPPWRDREYAWPGPDPIDELSALLRGPRLAVTRTPTPLLDLDGRWLELDTHWSPETISALAGKTWLTPVESALDRRRAGVSSQGATIGSSVSPGAPLRSPIGRIVATNEGLVVRFSRAASEGDARVAAASAPAPAPTDLVGAGVPTAVYPERTDFAAAFSATRNAVLVAGGIEEGRTAPAPLLLHSIETGGWIELPPPANHERASRTLSVGMDVTDGLAYVLDLVPQEGFFKGLTLLRLTRYALDGSSAKVVAVWPWSGSARGVHATVLEDGLLALTVVRKNAWQVFRVDARGAVLKLRGALAGQGRVLDGPVMGEREPVVPVLQMGKVRYETLRAERFGGLGTCSF